MAGFACDALQAALPLAKQMQAIAHEWSVTRKGRWVPEWEAHAALCGSPSSPCTLFAHTRTLLSRLAEYMQMGTSVPSVVAIGSEPSQFQTSQLATWLAQTYGWNATVLNTRPHGGSTPRQVTSVKVYTQRIDAASVARLQDSTLLLLLDSDETHSWWPAVIEAVRPWVIIFNETSHSAQNLSRLLRERSGMTYESYQAPYALSELADGRSGRRHSRRAQASGRQLRPQSRRSRAKARQDEKGPPVGPTTMWRLPEGCTPPLWDLRRPENLALPAEIASAAAAMRAGVPYSEWFVCHTLEQLRPLARLLFTLPRRLEKSVWHTCVREGSPCFWVCCGSRTPASRLVESTQLLCLTCGRCCGQYTGSHSEGEHFVTQVLSSPDMLLRRLSAHRTAATAAATLADSATLRAAPSFLLVDPAAGDGNYTQHLPDGMGRLPSLAVVGSLGWDALLTEPVPSTFKWLERNFAAHAASGRVSLRRVGVAADSVPKDTSMFSLSARVAALATHAHNEDGLPMVTRQRLQWPSSVDRRIPEHAMDDLWQINHLAGGPIVDALNVAGHTKEAKEFKACKDASATRKERCFPLEVQQERVRLVVWEDLLRGLPGGQRTLDLLVLNVWGESRHQRRRDSAAAAVVLHGGVNASVDDGGISAMLKAFPLDRLKPTLIYYRHPVGRKATEALREHLLAHGYETSAHWETGAWGELNLAWRADRCGASGMPGQPPWQGPES